jgi:hypothetical protein
MIDSTTLVVEASLRRTATGGMAGLVETVRIGSPGIPPRTPDGLSLPFAVTAPLASPGQAVLFSPASPSTRAGCPSPVPSALNALRDLVIRVPDSLHVGATWSDSARTTACAGHGELSMEATRTYVVAEHVGAGVVDSVPDDHVVVRRTTRLTVAGNLARNDDTTRISGSGTGTLTLLVSTVTGDVLVGSGSVAVDLSVRSALREETARQIAAIRLRRIR